MSDLQHHVEYMASFGFGEDQMPVCILTVLKPGMSGRDCAAYRGVVPAYKRSDPDTWQQCLSDVCSLGNKISEIEANDMFDLGELRYRR